MAKNVPLSDEQKTLIAEEYAELEAQNVQALAIQEILAVKLGLSPRTVRAYRNYGKTPVDVPQKLTKAEFEQQHGSIKPLEAVTSSDFELPEPRILLIDIETAPNLSYVWGHYEQNVIQHDTEWYILSWSVRWLHDDPVTKCLADYPHYVAGADDDSALMQELWKYLDEADVVVWQNGDKFDYRKINTRFLKHAIRPPRPYRTVDTLKIARKHFAFNSNKLDDLGKYLGVGHKLEHKGFELWKGCLIGDAESWAMMKAYNEMDVTLLQSVYLKLLPWIFSHPNTSTMKNLVDCCRNCGSSTILQEGFILTATGKRPQYRCEHCDTWMQGRHIPQSTIR